MKLGEKRKTDSDLGYGDGQMIKRAGCVRVCVFVFMPNVCVSVR